MIEQLIGEFENYLDGMKQGFVVDLRALVDNVEREQTCRNIAALFVEYEYGDLNISCYAVDKRMQVVSELMELPSHLKDEPLFPVSLTTKFEAYVKNNVDKEDEIRDEFDRHKKRVFERWISDCWDEAITDKNRIAAYLSIHDSYFKTDLNTKQKINDDQIEGSL